MNTRMSRILAFVLLAGCGGGGGGGAAPAPPEMPSRLLYVNADAGPNAAYTQTYGMAVYPSGAISPLPGFSPAAALDGGGGPLVITRDSKLLYTTGINQIAAFQINPDGLLTNAPSPSLLMHDTPVGLVAHPTADFLYASSSTGILSVFAINAGTGALNLTSSVSLSGNNVEIAGSAVITPDGRYLYQADVPNGFNQPPALIQLAGFSIDSATGALSAVPGSPVSTMISISTLTNMAIDPTGKFLYASYGSATNSFAGGLAAFSIDSSTGALTALPGSPFSVGGRPTSVAIDASGKFLIVSVVPEAVGNCLDVLSIDPGTGALALVPGSPFGPAAPCGFVATDPSEPFVYAGADAPPATVFVLSVDQTTGALAPVGQAAVPDSYKGRCGFHRGDPLT